MKATGGWSLSPLHSEPMSVYSSFPTPLPLSPLHAFSSPNIIIRWGRGGYRPVLYWTILFLLTAELEQTSLRRRSTYLSHSYRLATHYQVENSVC